MVYLDDLVWAASWVGKGLADYGFANSQQRASVCGYGPWEN